MNHYMSSQCKFILPIAFLIGLLCITACRDERTQQDEVNTLDAIFSSPVGSLAGAYVDVLGFFKENGQKRYIVGIGPNVHVINDCPSDESIFELIDQEFSTPLNVEVALDSILADDYYQLRAELSCDPAKKPKSTEGNQLTDTMYYHEGSFFLGTGQQDEYYKVNEEQASCVYNMFTDLFSFEDRFSSLEYTAIPNAASAKVFELSCKDRSTTIYSLSSYTKDARIPFFPEIHTILFLEYNGTNEFGGSFTTRIPIYQVNGQRLAINTPVYDQLVAELRDHYKIESEIKILAPDALRILFGKTIFDYCLGCSPDSNSNTRSVQFRPPTPPSLLDQSSMVGTELTSLNGEELTNWKSSSGDAFQFKGCNQDLLAKLGIQTQSNDWFSTLRQQLFGQYKLEGSVFSCPSQTVAKRCDRILDRSDYTDAEINDIINDASGCQDTKTLTLRVDSAVTITGNNSIRFGSASPFERLIIQPFVPQDRRTITFQYRCSTSSQCTTASSFSSFKVSAGKVLEFRNLNYEAAIDRSRLNENETVRLELEAFNVSGAGKAIFKQARIQKSTQDSSPAWSTGIKAIGLQSVPACPFCPVTGESEPSDIILIGTEAKVDRVGISLDNSRLFMKDDQEQPSVISGLRQGINMVGASFSVVTQSHIQGSTLVSIGSASQAIIDNSRLLLTGDTRTDTVEAFLLYNAGSPSGTPFALELMASKIYGFPDAQVSNFTFADFTRAQAGTKVNMLDMEFFRQQDQEHALGSFMLPYFLSCEAEGILLYRFRNYCED